jgi:hypothetical protein
VLSVLVVHFSRPSFVVSEVLFVQLRVFPFIQKALFQAEGLPLIRV